MFFRFKNNKGQAAIEKIVLYSVVILVIMGGFYSLWKIGAFQSLIGKKGTAGFSQILIGDWSAGSNNRVFIELENHAEADLLVFSQGMNASTSLVQCEYGPDENLLIKAGESRIVELTCIGPPGMSSYYDIGDFYVMDLTVNYSNLLTTRNHESVGKLYGRLDGPVEEYYTAPTTTYPWCTCGTMECAAANQFDTICENTCIPEGSYPPGTPLEIECDFCFRTLMDGKIQVENWCWPRHNCGKVCDSDIRCVQQTWTWPDNYPEHLKVNPCTKCVDEFGNSPPPIIPPGDADKYTCRPERPDFDCDCGNDCDLVGQIGDPKCDPIDDPDCDCSYCAWYDYTDVFGHVVREQKCDNDAECGKLCLEYNYETQYYEDCVKEDTPAGKTCPWCNVTAATPTCEQGDCGKNCPDDETCKLGCRWCDLSVNRCDIGDCGAACETSDDCERGCECCNKPGFEPGKCVPCGLEVSIQVTDDIGEKIVEEIPDTILVTIRGETKGSGDISMKELWISDAILVQPTPTLNTLSLAREYCYEQAFARHNYMGLSNILVENVREGQITNPYTAEWLSGDITWDNTPPRMIDTCNTKICTNTISTTGLEADPLAAHIGSFHCFFGIGREDDVLGRGLYSNIVCDCIQTGFINVDLVSPKPV